MDSQTFDLAGMVSAVVKATETVGGELSNWAPAPAAGAAALLNQEELVRRLGTVAGDLTRIPELRAWAAWTADEINRLLAENGFEIRVSPWPPDALGVVAILDVTVEWLVAGEDDGVMARPGPGRYPGFLLAAVENRVEVHEGKSQNLFPIEQARQEVRFAMNEHGARAKTASVLVPRGVGSILKIDDDFLLWIERPGVSTPVFVGYFAKDSWQDPGSLDNV